ncbi:MAG: thioesterase family protein [Candidatus Cryptobacteroides sp.]|nr:thioesterase family protein [Candidatus Cryptobacteroides sp.]
MVATGIKGRQETTVTQANVASNVGSGTVRVFATPSMIALIEKAAVMSIEAYLEPGQSSVGTRIDVSHLAATPEGMKVWAETEVTEVDRRKVTFKVAAYDESGLIGEGTHERFIIDIDKFVAKAEAKKQF